MEPQNRVAVEGIEAGWLRARNVTLDILRLDQWHAVVSGNKWFKLQYYLADAVAKHCATVATFGGAFSNHIVATAFACQEAGLKSIGIIRGEKPPALSHTLREAEAYGMQLQFASREAYKDQEAIKETLTDVYWINEGGYGSLGAAGAADIGKLVADFDTYTHIACAVGTGTTLAGLVKAALPQQTVIGFSALKNNMSIQEEIENLLPRNDEQKAFVVRHDYHFGGYAKHNAALLQFMNEVWQQHQLPLDFVYTAKAFYGLQDMIVNEQMMADGSRVLFIHTGGLQGNLSLGKEAVPPFFPLHL